MIIEREKLKVVLEKYMIANSYSLSNKSKSFYALDSFVWSYTNLAGNRDNIKIEINYLNRNHILETKWYSVCDVFSDTSVNCVDLAEIFASKIIALLTRATPRDLYDISSYFQSELYCETSNDLLRKIVIIYGFFNGVDFRKNLQILENIDRITDYQIKCSLIPVLNKRDCFSVDIAKKLCREELNRILTIDDSDIVFLTEAFDNGLWKPELLFDDHNIVSRLKLHPAAKWKIQQLEKLRLNIKN